MLTEYAAKCHNGFTGLNVPRSNAIAPMPQERPKAQRMKILNCLAFAGFNGQEAL